MALVLTSSTNPGTAAWEDATTLPPPALPFEVITLNSSSYVIPDGASRFLLIVVDGVGNTITLPSAAANPGVTLTLTVLSTGAVDVLTTGDAIGPYSLPAYTLDAAGSPRSYQFISVPAAAETGLNYWMLVASE